jgi:virginiamycin A acetyltransferase
MTLPDPDVLHPLPDHPRVVHLRPLAEGRANVTIGPFAYYDDPEQAEAFFDRNVLHHHAFLGDRLTIGAFTAIATGARIVMNGANHDLRGFTTFPFDVFPGWDQDFDLAGYRAQTRGDTVIGPDVWIGGEAWILPGVTIGAGAIVAAKAVVTRDVAPYAVVAGNPAQEVRRRYDPDTVARLLRLAWWDWPVERLRPALPALRRGDLAALEALA